MRTDARDPNPGAHRALASRAGLPAAPVSLAAQRPYDDDELGYEAALPALLGLVAAGGEAAATRAATLPPG